MVALWKVCFDESLDGAKQESCVVAGVIGDKRQWKKLYSAWDRALEKGKSIPYYSGKDGGSRDDPKSVFYGWGSEQISSKRRQLAEAISRHAGEIFWSGLDLQMFNAFVARNSELPKVWRDPFIPPFCTALQITGFFMENQEKRYASNIRKPRIVFDSLSSRKHQSRLESVYGVYRDSDDGVARWLRHNPDFADDKREERGLQMADLISGEMRYSRTRTLQGRGGKSEVMEILDALHSKGAIITLAQLEDWKAQTLEMIVRAKKKGHLDDG